MKTDRDTTVQSLKAEMQSFVEERNWMQYHTPKNLAGSISIEAAELLELFQWLTPEEAAELSEQDPEFRQSVSEEMSDVILYLLALANRIDLDISSAVTAKLQKNRSKYPVQDYYGRFSCTAEANTRTD